MSIDEAIEKESKIAKENQKIVDTQIVFDDVSLSQLYCDDTEVIEEHLDNYKKCAEYHEQLAEWLEELKELREYFNSTEIGKYRFQKGYNKAIDDFVNACKSNSLCQTFGLRQSDIEKIAEQLKAGGENEQSI